MVFSSKILMQLESSPHDLNWDYFFVFFPILFFLSFKYNLLRAFFEKIKQKYKIQRIMTP